MPLFVNQSAVSERENSQNPQREEGERGAGGAGDDGGEEGREGAGTSNSFSESLSFSGRRFLGVQG